jgi:multiple sugar transport system substrate-binding protein
VLRWSAAAAASAALAGGCSRERDELPGVVTLDFFNYASPEFLDLYNKRLIPAFEAANPKIRIRMTTNLGDAGYDAKLLTMIAGGIAPDLFHVTQQNFPFYAAKGVILPCDELAAADPAFSPETLYETVVNGMRYEGKLLGLPSDFSTIVMLYNQDLFDQYGVNYPAENWTWADFLDASRRLTRDQNGDGYTDVYGTNNPNAYNRWPAWVWMNGGDVFSPDLSRCTMDTPEAINGLQFYVDLARRYGVAPTPIQSAEMEGLRLQEMFGSGRLGIVAESRYQYKKFLRGRGVPFRWDAAPMPKGKELATTFIWGGNCILASTKHPRESWEFLKFLAGPEGASANLDGGNALPVYRPAADAEVANPRHPRTPKHDHYFIDAIDYARVAPAPEQFAEVSLAMAGLHDAFLGLKTVREACIRFTNEVNDVLGGRVF